MLLRIGYVAIVMFGGLGLASLTGRQVLNPPTGTVKNDTTLNKQMGINQFLTKGSLEIIGNTVSPRVVVEYGEVVNGVYTPIAGSKQDATLTFVKNGVYTWTGPIYQATGGKTYKVTATLYAAAGGPPPGKEKFCAEHNLQYNVP